MQAQEEEEKENIDTDIEEIAYRIQPRGRIYNQLPPQLTVSQIYEGNKDDLTSAFASELGREGFSEIISRYAIYSLRTCFRVSEFCERIHHTRPVVEFYFSRQSVYLSMLDNIGVFFYRWNCTISSTMI